MPSGTFVMHRIVRFPAGCADLQTRKRRPTGSQDLLADPVYTGLHLSKQLSAGGFALATVRHRRRVKISGLWHGNRISEAVEEKRFQAFYSRPKELFISRVERDVAQAAVARLNKELSKEHRGRFRLEKVGLDLAPILQGATNVFGAWFKRKARAPIQSQAAFGRQIRRDVEYKYMAKHGALRSLTALFSFQGKSLKASISSAGSVYFKDNYDIKVCLGFVEHLSRIAAVSP